MRCLWLLLLLLAAVSANSTQDGWQDEAVGEKPLREGLKAMVRLLWPDVQDLLYQEGLPTECTSSLIRLFLGVKNFELWALQFLDASAKIPSGLIEGTTADLGSYDECLGIHVPDTDGEEYMRGQYCSLYVNANRNSWARRAYHSILKHPLLRSRKVNSTLFEGGLGGAARGVRLGMCLPSLCSQHDIQFIANKVTKKFGIQIEVATCSTGNRSIIDSAQVTVICILLSLCLLTCATTALDRIASSTNIKSKQQGCTWKDVLLSFSCRRTLEGLYDTASSEVSCIQGLKVLCVLWIILGATYESEDVSVYGRVFGFMEMLKCFGFLIVTNANYAFSVAFFLSGFVASFAMLKSVKKNSTLTLLSFTVVKRYIRVTVPCLFIMGVFLVFPLVFEGPSVEATVVTRIQNCYSRWWTVLFQVSNLNSHENMCYTPLWYVSTDTQLFIVLIWLTLVLVRFPTTGYSTFAFLLSLSCICVGIQNYKNSYLPAVAFIPGYDFQQVINTLDHVYYKPFCHVPAFIIGILTAYCTVHYDPKNRRSKFFHGLCWMVAVLCIGLPSVLPFSWNRGRRLSPTVVAFYAGGHELLWTFGIAWIVYACATGRGGVLNNWLSCTLFKPLSRLAFGAFLLHKMVLLSSVSTTRERIYSSYMILTREYISNVFLSFAAAFMYYILCEGPLLLLLSLGWRCVEKRNHRKTKEQPEERRAYFLSELLKQELKGYPNPSLVLHL